LVGKDPCQHAATVLERRALSDNGSRHGVVTTNTNTHEDTETEKVPELVASRTRHVIWQRDQEDDTDHGDDKLLAVDEFAAENITEETETNLTNNVTNVGTSVNGTTKKKRIGSDLVAGRETTPVFVGPDRSDQVDDEQVVGVKHETNTTNGEELEVVAGHSGVSRESLARRVGCFVLLLDRLLDTVVVMQCSMKIAYKGDDVAILILAGVGFFAPMHDCCSCLLKADAAAR